MEDYDIRELKRRLAGLLEERQMWRQTHMTLTETEREAIATAIAECESMPVAKSRGAADTLRALLERTK